MVSKKGIIFCPNCGSKMSNNAKFCIKCGAKLTDYSFESSGIIEIKDSVIQRSNITQIGKIEQKAPTSCPECKGKGYIICDGEPKIVDPPFEYTFFEIIKYIFRVYPCYGTGKCTVVCRDKGLPFWPDIEVMKDPTETGQCEDGKCATCHGTGMEKGLESLDIFGAGKCSTCKGTKICFVCKGDAKCTYCGGTGKFKCKKCKGTGIWDIEKDYKKKKKR